MDFDDYSLEEIDEMDEWQMIEQDINDEGAVFQDKLDMYRNEF